MAAEDLVSVGMKRMSGADFDRIMGQVLAVKPKAKKPSRAKRKSVKKPRG